MNIWGRKRRIKEATDEALKAKIEASIDLAAAQETRREVKENSKVLRNINQTNHFSESLTHAFRGRLT